MTRTDFLNFIFRKGIEFERVGCRSICAASHGGRDANARF